MAQIYEVRYLRGARTLHPFWSCSVYQEHNEHDHINTDRNLAKMLVLTKQTTLSRWMVICIYLSNNQDGPQFTV